MAEHDSCRPALEQDEFAVPRTSMPGSSRTSIHYMFGSSIRVKNLRIRSQCPMAPSQMVHRQAVQPVGRSRIMSKLGTACSSSEQAKAKHEPATAEPLSIPKTASRIRNVASDVVRGANDKRL